MPVRKVVTTNEAPVPVGPYSQAVVAADKVFTAGQLGIDPATGKLVGEGVEEQTRQALQNLRAILAAAGTSLEKAVKVTVFLTDMGAFPLMNRVYAEFFPKDPPARTCIGVAALPMGAAVEIEAVAALPAHS
ncbi:MAG: Rid family detoxifying hydrolase [Bacillota bacterium]|nr:Rid family detoxifying hydrolase [Bacillota bacterium]MDI7249195.1 Rid family detoxifying hydrolase [Bacillota bacterium]